MVIKRKIKTSDVWCNYKRLLLAFVLSIVLCFICTPSSTSANDYIYTELNPPGVTWNIWAHGINNKGTVVGDVSFWGFLYSEGTYTEFISPGWKVVYPSGINDKGIVVGSGDDGTSNYSRAFMATPSPEK